MGYCWLPHCKKKWRLGNHKNGLAEPLQSLIKFFVNYKTNCKIKQGSVFFPFYVF